MVIGELLALYQVHHLAGKPSAPYYARLVKQVFPPLASHEVDLIPVELLLQWWTDLRDRPGHANKAIGLYRAAHRWAFGLRMIASTDQTVGLKKRPAPMRSQTTSPEEWSRVAPLLEDLRLKYRVYFWMLYLVGSRPGEVRTARWEQIRLDDKEPSWVKPTTKPQRPHVVPLEPILVQLLRLLRMITPAASPWLFCGESPAVVWGRTSAQKLWERIRDGAGLPHLWLNDLRRSTASDLLNQGENLGIVQAQLGHHSFSQTARYAYLAVTPLRVALERRTRGILDRLDPGGIHA